MNYRRLKSSATLPPIMAALLIFTGLLIATNIQPAFAQEKLRFGWAKASPNMVAHIVPEYAKKRGLTIESLNFTTGVDIVTALGAGDIDIGLITPQHLVRTVDAKLGLVAILGNARGGTRMIIHSKYKISYGDWDGLKKLIADLKAQGKKLKVGSSRGSVNEALSRLTLEKNGISADRDLEIVNIPNPAIHHTALQQGQVDMLFSWEPWSSITVMELYGTTFAFPYDTDAGDLNTNFMTNKKFNDDPKNKTAIQKFVDSIVEASQYLQNNRKADIDLNVKVLGIKRDIAVNAMSNIFHNVDLGIEETIALAKLNAQLKWTEKDVSGEITKWVDESYLKKALGK